MITGVLPSLRYVLITDYLLDNLDDDELEAIVAHEIGHGRQHHLLAKTGAWLGLIVVWAVAVAVLPGALGVVPLVLFLGLFVVHGRVGVLLEQKADDYACEQVGTEAVVRALEKLAALNMLKRRTGRLWDALQQHPGIERRIARLQQRVAPAGRPS
jgi:STE24 endopeptidase